MATLPILLGGASAPGPQLDLSISGLRNTKGQVLICLTSNPKGFPDCSKDKTATRLAVKASNAARMTIAVPGNGTYAIALIHDENSNNKMDMALFLPKEGFGFSRNPTITTGPPKFKSASFTVSGDSAQAVKMKYML